MPSVPKRKKLHAAAGGSANKKGPRRTADGSATTSSGKAPGPVVGIGASAGGLEALRKLFGAMPPKTGLVFVVVVHLDPDHRSHMPELLAHATRLAVHQARDRQPLEVDHVYVIPPNHTLTVDGGLIRLQEVADRRGLHGSIDIFFRSLATAEGDRAVAIVLSGTGTEGSLGARAVKAVGGLVMAQALETAVHSGMPGSAIATGVADLVLPPEQMPQALFAYVRDAVATPAPPAAQAKPGEGLHAIVDILRTRSRLDLRGYRSATLRRRVARRIGLHHLGNLDHYIEFLRAHPMEVDQLVKDLLAVPTGFFRDAGAWDDLATQVLPALARSHGAAAPIRLWVPACSTGEEAYSLAILLAEDPQVTESGCEVQIFATDMSEDSLAVARAGCYPESIALDITPQRLARFFVGKHQRYTIRKSIRDSIIFAVHSPTDDPPFLKLDLIDCRSVLLHLERQMQDKLLTLFHFALNPGGYLFLGRAESPRPRQELFEPLSMQQRIFRRVEPATRPQLEFQAKTVLSVASEGPGAKTDSEPIVTALADRRLLEHFGATAVLVRSTGEILRFYGAVARYLQLPSGTPTLDVFKLARPALRPLLREALRKSIQENRQIALEALEALEMDGEHRTAALQITIKPVSPPGAAGRLWLIIFEEAAAQAQPARSPRRRAGNGSELVGRLTIELKATRKEHEHLVGELAEGNERLKTANEEVLAMNEELQSTNEELTTSKEELQSMNEELTTLNGQLESNVVELTGANDDLASLLLSTDDATLMVDTELRIKRFTGAGSRLLNVLVADIERPLTHIATNLIDVSLAAEARAVLADLQPIAKEVATPDGRQYLLRVLPHRTAEQRVAGVVLTLVDLSTLKRTQRELRAAREEVAEDLRRMTRLHELGERIAVPGEQRSLLEEILRAGIEITDAQMGHIQECNTAGDMTLAAQVGFEQPVGSHSNIACWGVHSGRRRVLVEDVSTSELLDPPSRQALLAAGVRALQSTPLFDRSGQLLGVFSTHYRAPRRFDGAELRWVDLLARHASEAIERSRVDVALRRAREDLEHRVAERTQWLTLLNDISDSINDAPTWDSALQRVLQRLCATDEWQVGYVYLPDPEAPNVIAPAISCISDERLRPFHEISERQRYARGESLPGRVYSQGVSKYADVSDELLRAIPIRAAAARELGLQAGMAHAITTGQEVIAVLELFSDRAHPRNDWFDKVLPAVADQIRRILEREQTTARMADLVWREQQDLLHTLHDALGQTLTGLGMLSAGLRQQLTAVPLADAADTAAEIARQAQHALEQVRQLSRSLFPIEVEPASLTAALRELAFATQSLHKLQVRVEGQVPETFSDGGAATQLYRIAQEAVTNAVKHAQARSITIHIGRQASMLRLRITDDGVGIDRVAASGGIGLQIMRYRAHSIGGILTVEPDSRGGTVVTCTLRTIPARNAAPTPQPQESLTQTGSTRD